MALIYFGMRVLQIALPFNISNKRVYMGLGALIALLAATYWSRIPNASDLGNIPGVATGPSFGLFLGLFAGVAVLVGGYLGGRTQLTGR